MLVLVLVALVSGCLAGNLVEEIEKAGATTALSMIQSVGLDTSLMSGYYTVFVPTNEAFAALPTELLDLVKGNMTVRTNILQYHALPAIFRLQDAFNDLQLKASNGQDIRINVYREGDSTPAVVTAEGRRVVQADIEASNGYLHLVDRVLLPPIGNLYHLLEMSDDLAVFKSLIDAAGLQSELTDHQGTLLVPTNDAFSEAVAVMGQSTIDAIKANTVVLREVLLYHMMEAVIYGPGAFNGTYPSKDMATRLQVSTGGDGVTYVNHARVVVDDVPATNGAMHVLDKVLIPPKYVAAPIVGK